MKPTSIHLIFLHLYALLWGIHLSVTDRQDAVTLLFSLAAGIIVVWACAADARRRKTPLTSIVQLIMLFTWTVSATIYLIWSRGWRGILWAMLWNFTFVSCLLLPAVFALLRK